jgi:large subunit ribosomal protein L25
MATQATLQASRRTDTGKGAARALRREGKIPGVIYGHNRAAEAVVVEVPVHLTGTPDGVRNFGGVLDQVLHSLELQVLPGDIPERIELDVTGLGIGQSLHVSDVSVPSAKVLNDPELPICSVVAPRVDETAAPAEEGATGEPELIRKPRAEDADEQG